MVENPGDTHPGLLRRAREPVNDSSSEDEHTEIILTESAQPVLIQAGGQPLVGERLGETHLAATANVVESDVSS